MAIAYEGPKPTQVLWRRIFAYLIDTAIGVGIATALFFSFAESDAVSDCPATIPDDRFCLFADDAAVAVVNESAVWIFAGALLGYALVMYVLVQGLTGATFGKLLLGVRCVRRDGSDPGIGKALLRTLLLPIDLLQVLLPLGLWLAIFSARNQRLGDLAARTFVVRRGAAGRPLLFPGDSLPEITFVPDEPVPDRRDRV